MQTKSVIITGTNRGIGKVLVKCFAEEKYNIWACARKKSDEFENELQQLAKKENVLIRPVYFDLTDSEEMKKSVKQILNGKERIDVLVNCAGVAHGGLFQMTKMTTVKQIFEVNLFSMMELTQLVLRAMVRQKSGCIINFSSISGLDLRSGNCAYGASKAAIIAWTKTLAAEVAKLGIRVNAIAPGLTDTDMASLMNEKAGYEMVSSSALNRLLKPEEIADVVLFLSSEKSSTINGQVIRVDGGPNR